MSLKNIVLLSLATFSLYARFQDVSAPLILINPAGDSKDTGRTIDDTFERTIAMEFAEQLRTKLNELMPTSSILITRSPGEIIHPLQNATFANRLNISLFISIHFFRTTDKNSITLFRFYYADPIVRNSNDLLQFIPIEKAYIQNYGTTTDMANLMLAELHQQQKIISFSLPGLYSFPFAPLLGIQCPALGIEIGITSKNEWKQLIQPIATALKSSLETA